jgi:hypothetical protein
MTSMKKLFHLREEMQQAITAERTHRRKHPFDFKGRKPLTLERKSRSLAYNEIAFRALEENYGIEPHSVKVANRKIDWKKDAMTDLTAIVDGYRMNLHLAAHNGEMIVITKDGKSLLAV